MHGGRRSAPSCRCFGSSGSPTSGRRSSSPPGSGGGRAGRSSTGCSRRLSPVRSTGGCACTTSRARTSSSSARRPVSRFGSHPRSRRRTSSLRQRGGDGAARRAGGLARRRRAGCAAGGRCRFSPRAERRPRLGPRAGRRTRGRREERAHRRLARARPTSHRRHGVRLPLRPRCGRAHRPLAGGPPLPPRPRAGPASVPPLLADVADRRRRLRRSPSVAHAEAFVRATDLRSVDLDEPLEALCLGIPRTTPHLPRERPNPMLAAYLGLGLACRMWRSRPTVVEGGTVILAHRFHRRFSHPTQQPYRAFFHATRAGLDPEVIAGAEAAASIDDRAISRYRGGRSCHPRLPFADWSAIEAQAARLGAVIIAGCRDAGAARQLGFIPSQSVGSAIDLALGRAGDRAAWASCSPLPTSRFASAARGSSRGTPSSARVAARRRSAPAFPPR